MTVFGNLADLIAQGKEFGIFQFYLPFVLTFAIIYGLLRKTKIFGELRQIDVIIALAAALYVMAMSPAGPIAMDLTTFLTGLFGGTLIIVVTLLAILMVANMIAPLGFKSMWMVVGLAVALVLGIFIASGGGAFFPGIVVGVPQWTAPVFPAVGLTTSDLAIIALVVFTGLIIWYLAKPGEEGRRGIETRRR